MWMCLSLWLKKGRREYFNDRRLRNNIKDIHFIDIGFSARHCQLLVLLLPLIDLTITNNQVKLHFFTFSLLLLHFVVPECIHNHPPKNKIPRRKKKNICVCVCVSVKWNLKLRNRNKMNESKKQPLVLTLCILLILALEWKMPVVTSKHSQLLALAAIHYNNVWNDGIR